MDWDQEFIRLYLDDELLNEIPLSATVNGSEGNHINPFKTPHYVLLNLAMGSNGGKIDEAVRGISSRCNMGRYRRSTYQRTWWWNPLSRRCLLLVWRT